MRRTYRVVALVVLCITCLNVANAEGNVPDTLFACYLLAASENPDASEELSEYLLTSLNDILFIIKTITIYFSIQVLDEPYAAILLPPPEVKAGSYFTAL